MTRPDYIVTEGEGENTAIVAVGTEEDLDDLTAEMQAGQTLWHPFITLEAL